MLSSSTCVALLAAIYAAAASTLPAVPCGSVSPNQRIMGGSQAGSHAWPWMVSLRYFINGHVGTHVCGGSLIFSRYVLTAGHCSHLFTARNVALVIGVNSQADALNSSQLFYASAVHTHPHFRLNISLDLLIHDIGIIELTREASASSNNPGLICLPTDDGSSVLGEKVVVAGWGSSSGQDSPVGLDPNLRQVTLIANTCPDGNGSYNASLLYCGSGATGNVCYGDSGGPMMYSRDGHWWLYGVVSGIVPNPFTNVCDPTRPSYFTQVPKYLDWVASVVGNKAMPLDIPRIGYSNRTLIILVVGFVVFLTAVTTPILVLQYRYGEAGRVGRCKDAVCRCCRSKKTPTVAYIMFEDE